jgi:FkbM family methyltransferase
LWFLRHPLAKQDPLSAIIRLWSWQLWRRTARRPVIITLPEGSRLACPPWSFLASAWATVGFHEYTEALFVIDLLQPEDLFIDVGANLGFYTVIAARRGARVISVEPGARQLETLQVNQRLNAITDRVTIVQCALSDFEGQALFTQHLESSNRLVIAASPTDAARVPVMTLDALMARHTRITAQAAQTVLKIDTEGFDLNVLQGGRLTIERAQPVILVEIWAGGIDVRAWLQSSGYGVYHYQPDQRRLIAFPDDFSGDGNFIAVPRSRLEEIVARLASSARPTLRQPRVQWRVPGSIGL